MPIERATKPRRHIHHIYREVIHQLAEREPVEHITRERFRLACKLLRRDAEDVLRDVALVRQVRAWRIRRERFTRRIKLAENGRTDLFPDG